MTSKRSNQPLYAVRPSAIAGLGVFAARRIARGTRIIEYTGELISDEEAGRRYDDDAMEQHHTFLFSVDDDMVIDGGVNGNEARYFNHACNPNCEAVNEEGRIFIEAIADIEPGTELLYDYALVREDKWKDHWAALYACRCGARRCRGTILKSPKPPRKTAKRAAQTPVKTAQRATKTPVTKARRAPVGSAAGAAVSDRKRAREGARRGAME